MTTLSTTTSTNLPTIEIIDGTSYCSSLDVADHFGKQHKNVIRDIEENITQVIEISNKLKSEPIVNLFKKDEYEITTGIGAKVKKPMYLLTKNGFTLLAMGYTGKKAMKFKLAYIEAFDKMEAELKSDCQKHQYAHLTDAHVNKLDAAIKERVKLSQQITGTKHITRSKLQSELRKTFESSSYFCIQDHHFTDAMVMVKTMALEGEIVDAPVKAEVEPSEKLDVKDQLAMKAHHLEAMSIVAQEG